jgi:hypothetical protein
MGRLFLRFENLTPHQCQRICSYVDTVLLTSYTPQALDIAAPQAASRYIVGELAERIVDKFSGRMAHVPLGAALQFCPLSEEGFSALATQFPHPMRFAVVITDRLVPSAFFETHAAGVTWLVFDWWKWLRDRIPQNRHADAWMFLSQAIPVYRNSDEQKALGLNESTALQMAEQGVRLFDRVVEWISEELTKAWRTLDSCKSH